jgi:ATP/maltotriose-dependent transcriptional regulator MalT
MRARYDQLLRDAQDAVAQGNLERSAELFGEAEQLATAHGCEDLADRALCSRCGVLIELDQASALIPELKHVLLRSSDARNRFLAAYYTAMAYDLDDEADKAASYAERATALAAELDEPELTASAANLAGNLALRDSRFEEAEAAYSRALSCHRGLDGFYRIMEAQENDNMGYVLMCTGRIGEGLALCEAARACLEELEADDYLSQTLQDLCYGYILDEQLARAEACGEQALDLAFAADDGLVVKNCLFLLSEIAVRRGDTFRARRYLRDLAAYYPEVALSEEIIDVFLTTDLTTVVNLRG